MSQITSALAGAALILDAGRAAGLPEPFTITASSHDAVTMQFWTVDQLEEWSAYLNSPIGEYQGENGVRHSIEAELFEQPLRLSCYVRAEVVA